MIMQLVQQQLKKDSKNIRSRFCSNDSHLDINLQLTSEEVLFINNYSKSNSNNTVFSLPVPTNWR